MPALVYHLLATAYAVPALMEQWNERYGCLVSGWRGVRVSVD